MPFAESAAEPAQAGGGRTPGVATAIALPLALLAAQCAAFGLLPRASSIEWAYLLMIAAPVLAALAALWRGLIERADARLGWLAVALSMAVWAAGAFSNYWEDVVAGRVYEMHRGSILAFHLAIVPLTFLLAGGWSGSGRRVPRLIDALLAMALGYAYFLVTWAMLTARGAPDEAGVRAMLWLMDAQNLVLAIGALIRWRAAAEAKEGELFRALAVYTVGYALIAFVNNHYMAADPEFGARESSVVTVVFALLAAIALWPSRAAPPPAPRGRFARAVLTASPLFLAGTLLIVSLLLIRVDYAFGAAGVLIAVLGYGLRSTMMQVRHIERGERLQRDRSALRAIAWTDALTGVANRRYFDQALGAAWRRSAEAGTSLSVLMIDIDHFKLLNDRYGHPAGDACLREVARALRDALVRPGDLLARYGGEEFVALLHEADAAGSAVVAERLRAAVQALSIDNADSPLGSVSVSIGAASALPAPEVAATTVVDAADKALYEAKCAGRNRVETAA